MSRGEAQKKVREAGGKVASAVNKNLNYLVIGDEGSPLYGQGRKGSKQIKAESLIEEGAEMKIISETAFLQMLAGEAAGVLRRCRAWPVARICGTCSPARAKPMNRCGSLPSSIFVGIIRTFVWRKPIAPSIRAPRFPPEFLTFDRMKPLFFERRHCRSGQLALEIAPTMNSPAGLRRSKA